MSLAVYFLCFVSSMDSSWSFSFSFLSFLCSRKTWKFASFLFFYARNINFYARNINFLKLLENEVNCHWVVTTCTWPIKVTSFYVGDFQDIFSLSDWQTTELGSCKQAFLGGNKLWCRWDYSIKLTLNQRTSVRNRLWSRRVERRTKNKRKFTAQMT